LANTNLQLGLCGATAGCSFKKTTVSMNVTFIIYLAAIMSFVGWFIFSIYVGIGFVALPMDCFNSFIHRPKLMGVSEARAQRKVLLNRSQELMKIGESIAGEFIDYNDENHSKKERKKRKKIDSQEMNRFRALVDLLERDLEAFQLADPQNYRQYYNPLVPYFKLMFGIISVILTLVWLIQIILYMIFSPPLYGFLNIYLFLFDTWFPLFGTSTITIFGLYLLLAVAKGNFKF
jgi:LMBR1 domain-containing protein 1